MEPENIEFGERDAWLLLSTISEGHEPLPFVLARADMLERLVPTEQELREGFTRLIQAGLVQQKDNMVGVTPAGNQLVDRARSPNVRDWLRLLADQLTGGNYPKLNNQRFDPAPGEFQEIYERFRNLHQWCNEVRLMLLKSWDGLTVAGRVEALEALQGRLATIFIERAAELARADRPVGQVIKALGI